MALQIFLDMVLYAYGQTLLARYMPRSGNAGLYMMCGFNFIKDCQIAL